MEYLWVGLGGFAGANARYAMTKAATSRFGDAWPWGTFAVNVLGAFLIGILLTTLTDRGVTDPAARLVLVVGFLGGYTTFSSYTWEAIRLAERGNLLGAASYVIGSNAIGLAACAAGIAAARSLA